MRFVDEKWVASLMILSVVAPAPSFAEPVGQVVRLNPIVSVIREGQTIPLKVKDEIHLHDVIQTDTKGKVQVFFKDDTSVTLGNNSRANMKEFVEDGKNSRFEMNMAQGVARVITGKIVEKNPKGFAVTTPEATVGIRGTILLVNSFNGQTTVFVENTQKDVFVNGTQVPSGFKLTLPAGDTPMPEPMTPAEKDEIEAKSTVASNSNNIITTQDNILSVGTDRLSDIPLEIQALGDSDSLMLNLAVVPTEGKVSGTFGTGYSGTFSFDVGLTTGNVSNATMSASGSIGSGSPRLSSFSFSGGNGTLTNISGFVLDSYTAPATTVNSAEANMSFPSSIPAVGNTISGNYNFNFNTSDGPNNESGAATGTRIE